MIYIAICKLYYKVICRRNSIQFWAEIAELWYWIRAHCHTHWTCGTDNNINHTAITQWALLSKMQLLGHSGQTQRSGYALKTKDILIFNGYKRCQLWPHDLCHFQLCSAVVKCILYHQRFCRRATNYKLHVTSSYLRDESPMNKCKCNLKCEIQRIYFNRYLMILTIYNGGYNWIGIFDRIIINDCLNSLHVIITY